MDRRTAIKQAALITGYAISASAVSAVWQSCQRDSDSAADTWPPSFFTTDEGVAITQISDTILPPTDTPGASDVRVPQFVDQYAYRCLTQEEQKEFRDGLEQLLANCKAEYGIAFADCSQEQRLAFLNAADEQARSIAGLNPALKEEDHPFFLRLKGLVLMGYFTSEKIGKEVTAFLPVPGKYEPCAPYEEGQPAWTI